MAVRKTTQSEHDTVIGNIEALYQHHGKQVWTNPGREQNYSCWERYIDVIVVDNVPRPSTVLVIEVETAESVSDDEACNQWRDYDQVYTGRWYLAVPAESKLKAQNLLREHGIQHCILATWSLDEDQVYHYQGLPQASQPIEPTP